MRRYHVRFIRKLEHRLDALPDLPVKFMALAAEDLADALQQAAEEIRRGEEASEVTPRFYRMEIELAEGLGCSTLVALDRMRSQNLQSGGRA